MTSCAATMHAEIRAVSAPLFARASFCPTSGSIGALAKWKSATHTANTKRGLQVISTLQPDGCSCAPGVLRTRPRARAWSIARAGIDSTAEAVRIEKIGTRKNAAVWEDHQPTAPAST